MKFFWSFVHKVYLKTNSLCLAGWDEVHLVWGTGERWDFGFFATDSVGLGGVSATKNLNQETL